MQTGFADSVVEKDICANDDVVVADELTIFSVPR
jgi:hypothetical protein